MKDIFSNFINFFRKEAKGFPDKRVGRANATYKIEDITLSAFSVFHMQSPSFLQYQRNMEAKEGKSNAQSRVSKSHPIQYLTIPHFLDILV